MRAQPDGMREHLDWKGPSGLGLASGQPDSPAGGGVRVRSAIVHHRDRSDLDQPGRSQTGLQQPGRGQHGRDQSGLNQADRDRVCRECPVPGCVWGCRGGTWLSV